MSRRGHPELGVEYTLAEPFGDLPRGTRFTWTGATEVDWWNGGRMVAVEVRVVGESESRWLYEGDEKLTVRAPKKGKR